MRLSVIVNPSAGGGKAKRRVATLRDLLSTAAIAHEILVSEGPRHATHLVAAARAGGATVIGVMGGDGTLNEVCQAYVDDNGHPVTGPPLAVIPSGTGSDFARTLGLGPGLPEAVERIRRAQARALDLAVLTLGSDQQSATHHAFVNIASVGISADVAQRVASGPKWLGAKVTYLLGTLGSGVAYRNVPVEIEVDGAPWYRGPVVLTAIANGRYFGGGMMVAPAADPFDALFDVVCVGNLSRSQVFATLPGVYKGAHLNSPGVVTTRGRRVTIAALRDGRQHPVETDGELPGSLPLKAELFPGALQLLV